MYFLPCCTMSRHRTQLVYEGNQSHVIKNMAARVKFSSPLKGSFCCISSSRGILQVRRYVYSIQLCTKLFSGFLDPNCTVSLCTTSYISNHVTSFSFYILYCTVLWHRTACLHSPEILTVQQGQPRGVSSIGNPRQASTGLQLILECWTNLLSHCYLFNKISRAKMTAFLAECRVYLIQMKCS